MVRARGGVGAEMIDLVHEYHNIKKLTVFWVVLLGDSLLGKSSIIPQVVPVKSGVLRGVGWAPAT